MGMKIDCLLKSAAALGLLLCGATQAKADQIFTGQFYDNAGDAGSFTLSAHQDSPTQWTAISGTLTVTAGADLGVYDLFQAGDNPTSILYSSPSGNFSYDNNFFPLLDPVLDTSGILFVNTGSGAAGVFEVSFWGPLSPPGYGNYSHWSSTDVFGEYVVTNDATTFLIVPEPTSMAVWVTLFGMTAVAGLLKRNPLATPIVA